MLRKNTCHRGSYYIAISEAKNAYLEHCKWLQGQRDMMKYDYTLFI